MATNPAGRASGTRGASGVLTDVVELLRILSEQAGAVQEAADALPSEVSRNKEFRLPGGAGGILGFSIRSALAGQEPVVNEFGNVKMTNEGVVVSETREPLVDVFDEGKDILVVFELPGVAEGDINVELHGDVLALSAQGPRHHYESKTLLPAAVEADSAQQRYENGYLQVSYSKSGFTDANNDLAPQGREHQDD